jgi:hypothetical protein
MSYANNDLMKEFPRTFNHKSQIIDDQIKHNDQVRGAQIFQKSSSHFKILGIGMVRCYAASIGG